MPKYDVPRLADYSGAIQANNSMVNAFSSLGNQSQDYLKQEEQKKQNEWNKVFEENKMKLETDKYNSELQDKADKKEANATTMKTLFPEQVKEVGLQYGQMPTIENQNKMNNFLGNADIKSFYDNQKFINDNKKDERDYLYQTSRDKINDGFERERIGISRANANKPSELDRIMSILAPRLVGGKSEDVNIPKDTMQPNNNLAPTNGNINNSTAFVQPQTLQTNQPVVAPQGQQPLSVGSSNQPYTEIDYLTKGAEKTLKEDGNTYSFNPITRAKTLIEKAPEKDALATAKLRNELNDETISIQSAIKNSDKATEKINGLINNPNLKYATGALSFMGNIPGTPYKDIAGELEVVKGGAFSQAIESLRGLGAMSDADAKGVTSSIANLDRTQSSEQLKKQLGYIIDTVNIGKENAIQKLKNRGVNYQAPKETYPDEDILKKINGGK